MTTYETTAPQTRPSRGLKASANYLRESILEAWKTQKNELERLRDTARLRLHPTKMELDEMMQPFEQQLRTLENKVTEIQKASDDAVGGLGQGAAHVVAQVRRNFELLRRRIDAPRREG